MIDLIVVAGLDLTQARGESAVSQSRALVRFLYGIVLSTAPPAVTETVPLCIMAARKGGLVPMVVTKRSTEVDPELAR